MSCRRYDSHVFPPSSSFASPFGKKSRTHQSGGKSYMIWVPTTLAIASTLSHVLWALSNTAFTAMSTRWSWSFLVFAPSCIWRNHPLQSPNQVSRPQWSWRDGLLELGLKTPRFLMTLTIVLRSTGCHDGHPQFTVMFGKHHLKVGSLCLGFKHPGWDHAQEDKVLWNSSLQWHPHTHTWQTNPYTQWFHTW